jgi:hypothetical protein
METPSVAEMIKDLSEAVGPLVTNKDEAVTKLKAVIALRFTNIQAELALLNAELTEAAAPAPPPPPTTPSHKRLRAEDHAGKEDEPPKKRARHSVPWEERPHIMLQHMDGEIALSAWLPDTCKDPKIRSVISDALRDGNNAVLAAMAEGKIVASDAPEIPLELAGVPIVEWGTFEDDTDGGDLVVLCNRFSK